MADQYYNHRSVNTQWPEPGLGSVLEDEYDDYDYASHHTDLHVGGVTHDQYHLSKYLNDSERQQFFLHQDMTNSSQQSEQQHIKKMDEKLKAIDIDKQLEFNLKEKEESKNTKHQERKYSAKDPKKSKSKSK